MGRTLIIIVGSRSLLLKASDFKYEIRSIELKYTSTSLLRLIIPPRSINSAYWINVTEGGIFYTLKV